MWHIMSRWWTVRRCSESAEAPHEDEDEGTSAHRILPASRLNRELSATEEQEFDSGADSDGDWSPPSLSRAAKGKQRALPHESEEDKEDSASAEPDDEEEEIDPPDEDEGSVP